MLCFDVDAETLVTDVDVIITSIDIICRFGGDVVISVRAAIPLSPFLSFAYFSFVNSSGRSFLTLLKLVAFFSFRFNLVSRIGCVSSACLGAKVYLAASNQTGDDLSCFEKMNMISNFRNGRRFSFS